MILRHSVTWLTPTLSRNAEGQTVKTWAILKTTRADVQPTTLAENQQKLFGITDQQSAAKKVYMENDADIVEGLRMVYGGRLYDIRSGDGAEWDIHGELLAIPVIGESYSVPAPVITYFSPMSGAVGSTVTIHGTSLVGVTGITLGAPTIMQASSEIAISVYSVIDSTTIQVTIPTGANSGRFTITTANGIAVSPESFTVTA